MKHLSAGSLTEITQGNTRCLRHVSVCRVRCKEHRARVRCQIFAILPFVPVSLARTGWTSWKAVARKGQGCNFRVMFFRLIVQRWMMMVVRGWSICCTLPYPVEPQPSLGQLVCHKRVSSHTFVCVPEIMPYVNCARVVCNFE